MELLFSSGDHILIDVSRRVPMSPGIFVIWDDLELIAKPSPEQRRLSAVGRPLGHCRHAVTTSARSRSSTANRYPLLTVSNSTK